MKIILVSAHIAYIAPCQSVQRLGDRHLIKKIQPVLGYFTLSRVREQHHDDWLAVGFLVGQDRCEADDRRKIKESEPAGAFIVCQLGGRGGKITYGGVLKG
jgi:hypothetical protein